MRLYYKLFDGSNTQLPPDTSGYPNYLPIHQDTPITQLPGMFHFLLCIVANFARSLPEGQTVSVRWPKSGLTEF